jgi:hypothetical protein
MSKHTRKSKGSKGKKKSNNKGRPSSFAGKRIFKLVKENPRRPGSFGHKSFSKITNGIKYEAFIAAGGRRLDLAYDVKAKNVRVSK